MSHGQSTRGVRKLSTAPPRLDSNAPRRPNSAWPRRCECRRSRWEPAVDLIVRAARVHPTWGQRPEPVDVGVEGDRIVSVRPRGELDGNGNAARILEAGGRPLSPPLIDPHVHMDAVLTVGEPRHNESGTLIQGIQTWAERKPFLTHDDVKNRARQ